MTCDELLVYLSDYIDRDLNDEFVQVARDHLATCQHCQVVLNTTQRVVALGHNEQRKLDAGHRALLFDRLHSTLVARETPKA